jgi:hypothetical protein
LFWLIASRRFALRAIRQRHIGDIRTTVTASSCHAEFAAVVNCSCWQNALFSRPEKGSNWQQIENFMNIPSKRLGK